MGTIECSQPTFKSSWDSQDFGDISMVLKMAHFRKSTGPRGVKCWRDISSLKPTIHKYIEFCVKVTLSFIIHINIFMYVYAYNK